MSRSPIPHPRPGRLTRALVALAGALALAACGQSGALYLPNQPRVVAGSGTNPPPADAPGTLGAAGAQPVGLDQPQSLDTEVAPIGQ